MIKILPRSFDEMSVIQIKLKRHIDHQTDYMYETIKPSKVYEALKYLLSTPLYQKHDIKVDDSFFIGFEQNNTQDINFIVDNKDKPNNEHCELEKICSINESIYMENNNNNNDDNYSADNKINNLNDDFEINDEVLILDRNAEMTSNIITIAPGQDKQPLPWHKIEHIDELCFPRIFGGNMLDKEKKFDIL